MLSFASEFPVRSDCTSAAFLSALRDWIADSPHAHFVEEELARIGSASDTHIERDGHEVRWLHGSSEEQGLAVKRIDRELDIEWTTTIVLSTRPGDNWVGIRVERESSRPATVLPPAKKPIIVRNLLAKFGGATDGVLTVGNLPVFLGNNDIDLAARLILGRSGCHLPVIYVSSGFLPEQEIDSRKLARALSGMAHVVVEPNRPFSRRLKIEVHSENVYGGTVGIYWPEEGGRRAFFIGRQFEDVDEIAEAISTEIRSALLDRRPLSRCTWAAIQEARSREEIHALRQSGSQDVEKYVAAFDREISAKQKALSDAEREIQRLKAEIRKYEAKSASAGEIGLRPSEEQDLYPGEVAEFVREAIEEVVSRVQSDSRREHVLKAVLNTMPASGCLKANRDKLKESLRTTRDLDQKARKSLEGMGFAVTDDGKHYKLVFGDDDRYTFSLSKTGSDHRAGLNAASDISKRLF